jgi:hypothetical protein
MRFHEIVQCVCNTCYIHRLTIGYVGGAVCPKERAARKLTSVLPVMVFNMPMASSPPWEGLELCTRGQRQGRDPGCHAIAKRPCRYRRYYLRPKEAAKTTPERVQMRIQVMTP